jgi:hypothetical protein
MERNELHQYVNSAFEIHAPDGAVMDKIAGPGSIGQWLPTPDAPPAVAIFPVAYESFQREYPEETAYKVTRIFLNEDLEEKTGQQDEMTLVVFDPEKQEEAKEMTRTFGCNHFYWSAWYEDEEEITTRFIHLVEMENEVEIIYYSDY